MYRCISKYGLPKILFILGSSLFFACSDDDGAYTIDRTASSGDESSEETADLTDDQRVNTFVAGYMESVYLWNEEIEIPDTIPDMDPNEFFDALVYEGDEFSWLENEESTTTKSDDEDDSYLPDQYTESFGYSLYFGQFAESSTYFGVIAFVYKDSPAEEAGLQRGDCIVMVNGEWITDSNYLELLTGSSVSLTVGTLDKQTSTIYYGEETVELTAETMYLDPVVCDTVLVKGDRKIAYMAYAEYDYYSSDRLDEVVSNFQSEGVTDFILDLRFNTGGYTKTMIHLCSILAPYQVVSSGSLLLSNEYNDTYTAYLQKYGLESEVNDYFDSSVSVNLDLDQIYILTNYMTASASEGTIIGLDPYMDVVKVGGTTYGKCYGGSDLYPSMYDSDWTDLDNWVMYCITCKFANADGYTDFTDGIDPDVEVEFEIETVPLGDENDTHLAAALAEITGTSNYSFPLRSASSSSFKVEKRFVDPRQKGRLVRTPIVVEEDE